jgi:hypothetical protein
MPTAIIEGQQECQQLMETAFAFCRSQALFTGVELGLFSILEGSALSLSEVASKVGIDARGCRDFLDALVALGLLARENGKYSNTSMASRYLVKSGSSYIGDWFTFVAARLYPVWRHLPAAVRSGMPQNEALTEADYYANLGADKTRHEVFLKGMMGLSNRPAEVIASRFPWKKFHSFLDLGGASGSLGAQLLRCHNHLRGGVFDLPTVRPFFEAMSSCLAPRMQFHGGDFFVDPLPLADVYILGHILHNWDLDQKKSLLGRVRGALNPGGAVIIYEWLLDDDRQELLGLMDSLNMLLVTRTGCGIQERVCLELLQQTGFTNFGRLLDDDPYKIIVGWRDVPPQTL